MKTVVFGRWVPVVSIVAALAVAGCFSAGPPRTDASDSALIGGVEFPPGCDPARPAVAHRPGGVVVDTSPSNRPLPCLSRTGYPSFEPTIGVASTGTVFFYPSDDPVWSSMAVTEDDGATWKLRGPNLLGVLIHEVSFDPYFYLDPTTDRIFADDLSTLNCSTFSWSDDEGASWNHSLAGCMEFDHQTIFAGPPVFSPTVGYPNVVYRCALNTVITNHGSRSSTCQRSLDGGLTWLPPGETAFLADPREKGYADVPGYCDGLLGHGIADSKGRIYLPKGWCGQPWLAMSDNEGLTWTRVQVARNGMPRASSGVDDHEAGVGVDRDGNVYYGWIARDRMPYLAVSRDGGRTWGLPMAIGGPGLNESSRPALVVGGVGKVAFAYMGSTNSPGKPFVEGNCVQPLLNCYTLSPVDRDYTQVTWNGYMTLSLNALDAQPVFYTASINDPADPLIRGHCGPFSCQEVADFIDVRLAPDGTPWASYVDGCTGGCATGKQMFDNDYEGVAGRLWGGPSIRDEAPT